MCCTERQTHKPFLAIRAQPDLDRFMKYYGFIQPTGHSGFAIFDLLLGIFNKWTTLDLRTDLSVQLGS